jgi:hypothetical protein
MSFDRESRLPRVRNAETPATRDEGFGNAQTSGHLIRFLRTVSGSAPRRTLVAMVFLSGSADVLIPFAATVLPTVFLIGIFTVVRLVETALESMHYLDGIASIRGYYRTLGSDAARHFAPKNGRWPEVESPATRLGPVLGSFGTTASMIAIINNVVAGAGIALFTRLLSPSAPRWMDAAAGSVGAFVLTFVFYVYQRWRFREFNVQSREPIER